MTLNEILDIAIANWYIIAPSISLPILTVYGLKLLIAFVTNKKGKEVLMTLINAFTKDMGILFNSTISQVLEKVDLTRIELENQLKVLHNEQEAFTNTILQTEANKELLANYEKLKYQNAYLENELQTKMAHVKQDAREKLEQKITALNAAPSNLEQEIKSKKVKGLNKATKKVNKIKQEVVKGVNFNEINLE